jgi:hypothetical protein
MDGLGITCRCHHKLGGPGRRYGRQWVEEREHPRDLAVREDQDVHALPQKRAIELNDSKSEPDQVVVDIQPTGKNGSHTRVLPMKALNLLRDVLVSFVVIAGPKNLCVWSHAPKQQRQAARTVWFRPDLRIGHNDTLNFDGHGIHDAWTFDMSGGCRRAKHTGRCPLDRRVMRL